MFYTLLKFLGWGALLAFIGGCIGWALRSLKCRGDVARARSSTIDVEDVDRMRHRLANLEHVVTERDRLRIQLADVRHADSPGIVGAEVPEPDEPEPDAANDDDSVVAAESEPDADSTEAVDDTTSIVPDADADADADADPDDLQAAPADGSTAVAGLADVADATPDDDVAETDRPDVEPASLDLDAAAAALGKKVKLDDLTVVEGIGPKISELCSGIGVTTWRQLADVDVADLQSMLDAAGSRYAVHKPGTWPRQAELLATGQWAAFETLTDELDGGK